jgi:hypothetical protein
MKPAILNTDAIAKTNALFGENLTTPAVLLIDVPRSLSQHLRP